MALTDNLIWFSDFDEASGDLTDQHGSNNLADNGTVGSTTGKLNNCRDFENSVPEWFSIADNADFSTGDISFTWAGWVNFETVPASSVGMIIGKDDSTSGNREYIVGYNGFTGVWFMSVFKATDTEVSANLAHVPSAGNWHYIVAWHDASADTVNIQMDNGTPTSQATGGALQSSGSAPLNIGRRSYSGSEFPLDGKLDAWGFWKRVLTSDERTELWNSGNGMAYSDINPGGGGGSALLLRLMAEGAFI